MQFFRLLAAAAVVTVANALVQFTNPSYVGITVGVSFKITWAGNAGLVTLRLKNGPALSQVLVDTIASGLSGQSYSWTPSPSLGFGIYNLEVDDTNGDVNYSPQFTITGSAPGHANNSIPAYSVSTAVAPHSANLTVPTSIVYANKTAIQTGGSTPTRTGRITPPETSAVIANDAGRYASPFALVFMAVIATACLN